MASNSIAMMPGPSIQAEPDAAHSDILGVRLTIRSNHDRTRAAVIDHYRARRAAELDPNERAIVLTIDVGGASGAAGNIRVHATRDRLDLIGDGLCAEADAASGTALCRLSEHWADSPRLIEDVVEPLLLFLVSRADRTPIHAAAFMLDEVAVILSGPSGTGKSCLTYAAQRAGRPVLSDDIVYVQHHPKLGVWGLPQPIHVFPEDAPRATAAVLRWRNGKLKRAITSDNERPPVARRAVLCLIERGDAVALDIVRGSISPDGLPPLEPGFDLRAAESRAAHAALSARGFARLTLSGDPDEAIAILHRHGDELAAIAAG